MNTNKEAETWQEPLYWKLNRLVLEHIYKLPTRYYGSILGLALFIIDEHATESGGTIVGGAWQKGYSRQTGEIENFCGRLAPAFAQNIEHALLLEEEIARQARQEDYARTLAYIVGITRNLDNVLVSIGPFDMYRLAHADALKRTHAALLTYGIRAENYPDA